LLAFIARRLAATLLVVFVASFIVYVLTAYSGDPLEDLRTSRDPEAQNKIKDLTERLQLDVPPPIRYLFWLAGAAGCLVGRCDLGVSVARGEQPVIEALSTAIGSTLQLITLATVLSILVGITIGMTTALRQYSGYDYTVTFFAFIFYSLPIFWVAVLLKEFGAIRFNQFLGDPFIPPEVMIPLAIVLAVVLAGIIGGDLASRVRVAAISLLLSLALMFTLNVTQWLANPAIGHVGVILLVAVQTALLIMLSTGLANRRALLTGGTLVAAVAALWLPIQYLYFNLNSPIVIILTALIFAAIGIAAAMVFGGDTRRELGRLFGAAGALTAVPFAIDEMLQHWGEYTQIIPMKNGIVSTIGATTPALGRYDDIWLKMLDSAAHLVLPTIALMIVSVAGYTRYSRASLLEVLNQDYIRTARAKGLGERTVIMRHAFRNAMIPIATIITFDIAGLIGGAIITERVFAWQGMGGLFNQGLQAVDVNLVMGFFLITGLIAVVFNIVADLLYTSLDPRIRIG